MPRTIEVKRRTIETVEMLHVNAVQYIIEARIIGDEIDMYIEDFYNPVLCRVATIPCPEYAKRYQPSELLEYARNNYPYDHLDLT